MTSLGSLPLCWICLDGRQMSSQDQVCFQTAAACWRSKHSLWPGGLRPLASSKIPFSTKPLLVLILDRRTVEVRWQVAFSAQKVTRIADFTASVTWTSSYGTTEQHSPTLRNNFQTNLGRTWVDFLNTKPTLRWNTSRMHVTVRASGGGYWRVCGPWIQTSCGWAAVCGSGGSRGCSWSSQSSRRCSSPASGMARPSGSFGLAWDSSALRD